MTITLTVLLRVAGEGDRDLTLKKGTFTLKATRASSLSSSVSLQDAYFMGGCVIIDLMAPLFLGYSNTGEGLHPRAGSRANQRLVPPSSKAGK